MSLQAYPITVFNGAPSYSADMIRHLSLPFTIPQANGLMFAGVSFVLSPAADSNILTVDGLTVSIQPHAGYYSTGSDLYGGYYYALTSSMTVTVPDNTNNYIIVLTVSDPSTGAGETVDPTFSVLSSSATLPENSLVYASVTAGTVARSYFSYNPVEGFTVPNIQAYTSTVTSMPDGMKVTDQSTGYEYTWTNGTLTRSDTLISFSYQWSDPVYIDAALTPLAAASSNNADTGGATHMLQLYIHWLVMGSSSHNAWDKTVFAYMNGWQATDEIWGYLENDDTDHINYDMRFVCDGNQISIDSSSNYVLSQGNTYRGGLLIPVKRA